MQLGAGPPVEASGYEHDVCLSFAGEDRVYVDEVAAELRRLKIRVFYDRYEQVGLWGKDLATHLADVFQKKCRFCVLFASAAYASKVWTNYERANALARAVQQNVEYLLPARFDDTEIPGLRDTIGYIDLRGRSPVDFAHLIAEKLRPLALPEVVKRPPVPADVLPNASPQPEHPADQPSTPSGSPAPAAPPAGPTNKRRRRWMLALGASVVAIVVLVRVLLDMLGPSGTNSPPRDGSPATGTFTAKPHGGWSYATTSTVTTTAATSR